MLYEVITETVRQAFESDLDEEDLSKPQPIYFPTTGGKEAHAFYYAPQNKHYEAPQDERPPLLVISHGGPTGSAAAPPVDY